MPRLDFLDEADLSGEVGALLRNAESAGSPDPRVLKILFKSPAGVAWYKYWLELSNNGQLPKDLKELCRVKIAFDHECGYCGTVRSSAAKADGLTEEKIQEVWNFETSPLLSAREKLALRFADHLKHGIGKADDDAFYKELKQHFSDAEIVELGLWCAENVGAGSFVRTLNIISWAQACELNPETARHSAPERASA
jgi:AhpD family alkylhydroperoxidase